MNNSRELILVPIGGLCNRMRVIASGYEICIETNYRLTIIWIKDKGLNCNINNLFILPDDINIIQLNATGKVSDYFSRLTLNRYKNMSDNVYSLKELSTQYSEKINSPIHNLAALFKKGNKVYIEEGYKFYQLADYNMFHLLPKLSLYVDSLLEPAANKRLFGMHIRRTDNINAITNNPTESFLDTLYKELSDNNDVMFFLATDDNKIEQTIDSLFPARIIHIPCKNFSRNSKSGIIDGLIDLIALSRTQKIYGSDISSFSRTAAFLGKKSLFVCSEAGITEIRNPLP